MSSAEFDGPGASWREVARSTQGEDYAHAFAAHFDRLEKAGKDVHGEAAFVSSLVPPPASVLDAGCGTGRVAARLAELGYDVSGVDPDPSMIAVARERSSALHWTVAGLAEMDLGTTYDLVVMAGNVIPFVEPSSLPECARRIRRHTRPDGLVVCGFGWDRDHLPPGAPVIPLHLYDDACAAAGLALEHRYAGWSREEYTGAASGYAVSVHRRS